MTTETPAPTATDAPMWTTRAPDPSPSLRASSIPAKRSKPRKAAAPLPATLDRVLKVEFSEEVGRKGETAPPPALPGLDRWSRWADPKPEPATTAEIPESPTAALIEGRTGPGRPTKYKSEYCELVKAFMADSGRSLTAFAGFINVAPDTVYGWAETYPDFNEAARIAKAMRTNNLEAGMLAGKTNPEVIARIFALKNAAPQEWRERIEVENTHTLDPKLAQAVVDSAVRAAIDSGLGPILAQLQSSRTMRIESAERVENVIEGEFETVKGDGATN